MKNTITLKSSDEAIAAFSSGKPVWVLYSKPRAIITAIEKVTDGLVRIVTINGDTGLHAANEDERERTRRDEIRSATSNTSGRHSEIHERSDYRGIRSSGVDYAAVGKVRGELGQCGRLKPGNSPHRR